jgi:aspartate aminotransferase
MFSVIGANADQVTRLREQFGVYLVDGGRINLAGLKESDVPFLAESLSAVMA